MAATPDELAAGMRALLAERQSLLDAGAEAVGWKVGINVPALQRHFGLSGPVVGFLTRRSVLDPECRVAVGTWTNPALEVEVAVRVAEDGGVAGLGPALELVDLTPAAGLADVLACNVFHRGVVFGPEVRHGGIDLSGLAVKVLCNNSTVAEGALGELPEVTLAVVRRFLHDHGARLSPGDRVIAGSMIAPLPVSPGHTVDIDFGVLGHMEIAFE